jgi:hypothetical protein
VLECVSDLDHPSRRSQAGEVLREILANYGEADFARGVRAMMERFV